ncbi:MAG: 50S ribosomal protein L18 [bacterium]|nr:50S ribosomal protein L18 [bacterium]
MTKYLIGKKRRKIRVRAGFLKAKMRPRLSVFRSNKYLYAQIIDDKAGKTKVNATTKELKEKAPKLEEARTLGKIIAEKALKVGIKEVVFDRGSYKFHGRVKSLAEGAREGGLKF